MKILAVDDSKAVHAFMKTIFNGSEHTLLHAYDGEEAISMMSDGEGNIELILLDWEMPKMDGLTTLMNLRQKGYTVPIIMVTSRNQMDQIAQALEQGADEYIMKPFSKEVMLDKLNLVVG